MSPTLPKPLGDFFRTNTDAVSMLVVGFSDYIASRACRRFNCLFQSAILGEQALEKSFKAGLRLSGNTSPFKGMNHKLSGITKKLHKEGWFDFTVHMELIEALEYHFRMSRYPPVKEDLYYTDCRQGISSEQLDGLDTLILEFFEAIPVPDIIKFSLGAYGALHNKQVLDNFGLPALEWDALLWENVRLLSRLEEYQSLAAEHFEYLSTLPLPGLLTDSNM